MAGGLAVQVWKEWGIHILIVVSFLLQLLLLVFAGIRRRSSSAALMIILWLAYLMADNVAVYALGHMSLDSRPHEDSQLIAFWASFFLLHLGGQDNITAYSLEDNQLWRRHLLTLLVQATGAGYALYRYILPGSRSLISATVLMFIVGLLKYGERVLALKRGNLEAMDPYHVYHHGQRHQILDAEEGLLLDSHRLFGFCKTAFLNVSRGARWTDIYCSGATNITFERRLFNRSLYIYDLAESELSLLYDLLYTKAQVTHTWHGCSIRVISLLATVSAFLLFHLDGKVAYSIVDVAITYLLLVGAIILEIISVFRMLGSTWTCIYLYHQQFYLTFDVVMRLRRIVSAGSKRMWLHSIGQHNMLDYCSRDRTELIARIREAIGCEHWWQRVHLSSNVLVTGELKLMLLGEISNSLLHSENLIMETQGRAVLTKYKLWHDLGWSVESSDFAEGILIWHVATDIYICLYNSHQQDKDEEARLVNATKVLSNYMMFLLVAHPQFLPGGVQHNLLEQSYHNFEYKVMQLTRYGYSPKAETKKKLVNHLFQEYSRVASSATSAKCDDGARLAWMLLEIQSDIPTMLRIIFAVWVEFMCYAAHHSTDVSHCRQLGRGGEFLTVIRVVLYQSKLFKELDSGI